MASHSQRSILSCARCRRRKIKCGHQLPSCSQCISAKTECTGIAAKANSGSANNSNGASVATDRIPRSIVQHLESEIARLETELLQDGQLEVDNDHHYHVHAHSIPAIVKQSNSHQADLRHSILSSRSLQSVVSATLPHGSGAADLLSKVRMGITPSSAKVRERGNKIPLTGGISKSNSNNPGSVNGKNKASGILLHATILHSMPWDIVLRLMRKYFNTIQPDNPFLVISTVIKQFQNVADVLGVSHEVSCHGDTSSPLVAPSHDFRVVYLILAISVTLGSANDGHEERCMALSVSLFEEGIQHLFGAPPFPSDLAWLQTILLVLLYATVFPRSANVWVLSGAAMRSCLELGLHRDPPASITLDQDTVDLRRRVFWAAYCMDRSICSALQRPLSLPDASISTKLPISPTPTPPPAQSQQEDQPQQTTGHAATVDPFLGSVVFHKLLSEMLHVHFHREPIPPELLTWDDWLSSMEYRMRTWNRVYGKAVSFHRETTEFTLARGLMILHRPSPRVPYPAQRSLLVAFEAAATAERIHHDHIRAGFFRRPWLSAHYTLEAATVVLFCLRHGYVAIAERFSPAQIFEMTKLFTSNFLAISERGWPEVSVYAGVFKRLLGPLLERVFLRNPNLPVDRFGPSQDAELMRLLYQGPAHLENLRFGGLQDQDHDSYPNHYYDPHREDLSPFDFSLLIMDEEIWDNASFDMSGGPMGVAGVDGPITVSSADALDRWDMALPGVVEFDAV